MSLDEVIRINLPGGVPMEFRRIVDVKETAAFRMGQRGYAANEEPVRKVILNRPYFLGTFPVTQEQFAAWTESGDYAEWFEAHKEKLDEGAEPHRNFFSRDPQLPAENMSWHEADAFCGWLTRSGKLPAGFKAALPTEAQWEFACRKQSLTDYCNGDGEAALAEVGWFAGNAGERTHAVGGKPANTFGLHDMHGNVWEWCRDYFSADAYRRRPAGVTDPALLRPEDATREAVNPELAAATAVLGEVAAGQRQVNENNRGALRWLLNLAKTYSAGDSSWKPLAGAVEEAIEAGEWPEQATHVATNFHEVFHGYISSLEKDSDPPRVLRGGSWGGPARGCRSAYRNGGRAGNRGNYTGFRVCLFPGSVAQTDRQASGAGDRSRERLEGADGGGNRRSEGTEKAPA